MATKVTKAAEARAKPAAAKPADKLATKAKKEKEFKPDKPPSKVKLPKTDGACVDMLYETKMKRLAVQRENKDEIDGYSEIERAVTDYLIEKLPKSESNGVAGKLARVSVQKKVVPTVEDWSALFAFVVAEYTRHVKKKTGQQDAAFAVLSRSLNASTIGEMWDNDKVVPGVGKFNAVSLSINKL